jgi:tetraacyldisaccharide 4'-kinase
MRLAERLQRDWWRPGLTPLTAALWPLSLLYRAGAALDRRRQQAAALGVDLPVPVLVVGNLIVGGAGKTPTVIALAQRLREAGFHPGVISRGYGRADDTLRAVTRDSRAAEVGDEPLLMHLRSGAPVWVGRDRVAAAQALCAAHPEVNLLLSDDGLQHRRLPRRAELVVFDDRGAGNGRLLPAGPLREPLPAQWPPRTLALFNAARPPVALPGHLAQRRLAGATLLEDWWRGAAPSLERLHALRGRPVPAAAGMAHPQRFFDMLSAEGLQVQCLPLPDHHDFAALPWRAETPDVLVTEKDAVKLRPGTAGATRVWVVTLDFDLPDELVGRLASLLRPAVRPALHAPS